MRALSLLLLLTSLGCERLEQERTERQAAIDSREAIVRYAARVPETYPKQEAFVKAIATLGGVTDPAKLGPLAALKIAPAITAYADDLKAFDDIPPGILAAHQAMEAAHRSLAEAFKRFGTGLERKTYAANRAALALEVGRFNDAQQVYAAAAKAYYAEHAVDVTPPPPLSL